VTFDRFLGVALATSFGAFVTGMTMYGCATVCDEYEANKRVNFNVCMAYCTDAGHIADFEQGIGYVRCGCR
jgi:hypothetical protein